MNLFELILSRKKLLLSVGVPIISGVILYIVNSSILGYLFQALPFTLNLTFGNGAWWLGAGTFTKIAYVGFVAPVLEETVFRCLMLGWFIKKGHFYYGLAASSIIFGFWHMLSGWGILKAVNMIAVGIVFGLIYRKYGFQGSLIAHFANNWASLYAMRFYL